MKIRRKLSLYAFALCLFSSTAFAQVSITTLGSGGAYTQNFTVLGTGNFALTDNTSIPGVYADRDIGNATPNVFVADDGTSAVHEFKNYGSVGTLDRALGSLTDTGLTGTMYYGIRFQNDSGVTINSIQVSYVGEQWRNASASAQGYSFEYRQSPGNITNLTGGTYTAVPALNFITPTIGGTGTALDGNDPANRIVITATFLVTIPPGQEIMLRWTDFDDPGGADHGIAIDDVQVTFSSGTTAADATIAGRVVTADGRGISGARVVLSGGQLAEPIYALTNAFGYYTFNDLESGEIYSATVSSKRFRFSNPTRVISLNESAFEVDFVSMN